MNETALPRLSPFKRALRRLWIKFVRRKATIFAVLFLLFIVISSVLAPWLAPADPNAQDIEKRLVPPFWAPGGDASKVLGTDQLGRDVFSRILWGSRVSLAVGILSSALACLVGTLLGLLSGYFRGWVENVIMRVADIQLAIPYILLAITLVAILGPNLKNLVLVLGLTGWVNYARVVRAEVLSLREREFISAARALGASSFRIIHRHLLPNILSPIIVLSTLQVAQFIIAESSLSFLGLGVPISVPSWGGMLSESQLYVPLAPWMATYPGLAILLTVLSINLTGDFIRDALDPRLKL
ncbi:MAG: ABC transporter permease [Firmicutes bacterium]|nr:ABC transporter permease [Bacillota bacterium]